jgi:hypothetical protein
MARLRLLLAAAMLGTIMLVPATASAAPPTGAGITQSVTQGVAGVWSFVGNVNVTRVAVVNGQLTAIGTLTGTLTNLAAPVTSTAVNQAFAVPLALTGTCSILDLTLGPIHLDLLGLVVDLNAIHLTINAQSGPGNLLGNLLCAVAHLLDGTGQLGGLAALLNRILMILG